MNILIQITESYVIHKKNGGVSSARNVGIEHAVGDYIVFWVLMIFVRKIILNLCIIMLVIQMLMLFIADTIFISGK